MIFITVGNHTQGFERLLKKIDELARDKVISDVFVQTGYSDYQPKYCPYTQFVGFNGFQDLIRKSSIVITHGGAGSVLNALIHNKPIIAIPRLKKFGESINDHQLQLIKILEKEGKIIAVYDIGNLENAINKAATFTPKMPGREAKIIELIEEYLIGADLVSGGKYWNAYHKQWADRREIPANPRIIKAILSTLDVKNKKILEVGSGSGRDSIYLAKSGAESYLVDYAQSPLKIANEIANMEKTKIAAIKGEAKKLPFPDGYFDLVYSGGLMEHFTAPEVLIKEQRRVLKKGGYLLVDVPQKYHIYTLIKHFLMFFNRWVPGWETEYTIGQLERFMKGCELEIVSRYGDWSHPNLFLKALLIILKIPGRSPDIDFSQDSRNFIDRFKKTRLAHYTFQHIGVIARKVSD